MAKEQRRLGDGAGSFNLFWWPTLVFCICTYLVAIGDVDYKCLFGTLESISVRCHSSSGTYFLKVTLDVNCALDVLSDSLIMLLPVHLLWNVQVRLGKKFALLALFSLSIITMAVAIARAADISDTQKFNEMPDSTYLWFWSSLQSLLRVVVSCAASFRQLFVASSRSNSKPVASFRFRRKKPSGSGSQDMSSTSRAGEAFNPFDDDSMGAGPASGAASQSSSQSLVLVPRLGKPMATCYKAPGRNHTRANQITKEVEQ
ncbi:hypothetical protein ED733_000905 [Metarhizium rileyi]|uniref:Rhodopsin domain-containing protein n=1 Tax=Metarhizium rileyi (strain RCEF 4871) TaxID=1649241 RepID=A0A5C6G002_METRR|nr:hypothetical protein ED733_000905 [Metarhizium rileyi]